MFDTMQEKSLDFRKKNSELTNRLGEHRVVFLRRQKMRQIRITEESCLETDDGTTLVCPVISDIRGSCGCSNKCAWFNIRTGKDVETNKIAQEAYCGDKLIGRIKEKTDA